MARPRTRGAVNTDDLPPETDEQFDDGDNQRPATEGDAGMGVESGPAISEDPQIGFGEQIINIEEAWNHAVWELLEKRRALIQAHRDYEKSVRDVKKAFVYDGVDKVLRYGQHKIKITATPAGTKEISFTRGAGHRTHFGYEE